MDSSKLILTSMLIAGGLLTYQGIKDDSLSPRTYAGLALASLFLFALHSFAPDLAAAFAVLVLVMLLLSMGEDIIGLLDLLRPGQKGKG